MQISEVRPRIFTGDFHKKPILEIANLRKFFNAVTVTASDPNMLSHLFAFQKSRYKNIRFYIFLQAKIYKVETVSQ
jgi:hypothetical protein